MLQELFEIKTGKFVLIFTLLFLATYYMSTDFFATEDFLRYVYQNSDKDVLESGTKFTSFFFAFIGLKWVIGLYIKSTFIAFCLVPFLRLDFGLLWKTTTISLSAFLLSNVVKMIYFAIVPPDSILILRSNLISVYGLVQMGDKSIFWQDIAFKASIYEMVFVFLCIYGLAHQLKANEVKRKTVFVSIAVIVIDLLYILLSAGWKAL